MALDRIAQRCSEAIGGVYSPIIPVTRDEIKEPWWALLKTYDPDIIHSDLHLSETLVEQIAREIYPAKLVTCRQKLDSSSNHWSDRINFQDLSTSPVTEIPRLIGRDNHLYRNLEFQFIKSSGFDLNTSHFISQNFGCFPGTIHNNKTFSEVPHRPVELDELKILNYLEYLTESNAYPIFPLDISGFEKSNAISRKYNQFFTGRHIIVGDSLADRLYAWNYRSIASEGIRFPSLWLPECFIEDNTLLNLVASFLGKHGWSNADDKSRMLSFSLSSEKLKTVGKIFRDSRGHFYDVQSITVNEIPNIETYSHHNCQSTVTRLASLQDTNEWNQIYFPKDRNIYGNTGNVCCDIDIEFQGDPSIGYSSTNWWVLPKILGLPNSFFKDPHVLRINSKGSISVLTSSSSESSAFRVPDNRTLFYPAFRQMPFGITREQSKKWKKGRFVQSDISPQGQMVQAVLNIFGGVFQAGNVFENPFWRQIFMDLSGDLKGLVNDSMDEIANCISEKSREEIIKPQLEGVLLRMLKKKNRNFRTYKELKAIFNQVKSAYSDKRSEQFFRNNEDFSEYRENDLQGFVEDEILYQGIVQKCEACGIKEWYSTKEIFKACKCKRCHKRLRIDPNPKWGFRLNSLVTEALAYDVMPVVQALALLQNDSRKNFLYLPPTEIFCDPPWNRGQPFSDIDILAYIDGRFVVGEVKSSPASFSVDCISTMTKIAIDLKPDYVFLMAPSKGNSEVWSQEFNDAVESMKDEFKNHKVVTKVCPILMKWATSRHSIIPWAYED